MAVRLAQVLLFHRDGSKLKRFCDVVSGRVEIDTGTLLSYFMGAATVAHHPPEGMFGEGDVAVTIEVDTPEEVDRLYASLIRAGLEINEPPENTDWGWRNFYYRVAERLVFEVGAPLTR
ncbi:MAG: hypothetical protein HY791_09475 [Deltaproteobacteria bacterium]|nr:hypothetical protein [Deltaproteobacteria bacterium]